jgi:hypothetical protein
VVNNQSHQPSTPKRRVILLIPTVESRDFLPETLASVRKHAHCFDRLLLSVNGESPQKAQQIIYEQGLGSLIDVKIICTHRHLSAIQHCKFYLKTLAHLAGDQDLIFFLADDDLLPVEAPISAYICSLNDGENCCVGMGRFASFGDTHAGPSLQSQHINPGESLRPVDFLKRNEQGHLWTNVSSMIIPFAIFRESLFFMWLLGSSGRRTEYIFAAHRRVDSLYCPQGTSALIRQHPEQEGRTLSYHSYLHDELVYIVWVWLHRPVFRPWNRAPGQDFSSSRFRGHLKELMKRTCQRKSPPVYVFINRVVAFWKKT